MKEKSKKFRTTVLSKRRVKQDDNTVSEIESKKYKENMRCRRVEQMNYRD